MFKKESNVQNVIMLRHFVENCLLLYPKTRNISGHSQTVTNYE